jgi:hypothetical protein
MINLHLQWLIIMFKITDKLPNSRYENLLLHVLTSCSNLMDLTSQLPEPATTDEPSQQP